MIFIENLSVENRPWNNPVIIFLLLKDKEMQSLSAGSMMLLYTKIQELKTLESLISSSGQPGGETYSKKVVICLEEIYGILQDHETRIAALEARPF